MQQPSPSAKTSTKSNLPLQPPAAKDINHVYKEIQKETPPDEVNKGPFHVYLMVDGHRGKAVAQFIKDHFMDVLYRNENIMVKRYF